MTSRSAFVDYLRQTPVESHALLLRGLLAAIAASLDASAGIGLRVEG